MTFEIYFTQKALKDIEKIKKSGLWSRRLNSKHRLIYSVNGQTITVTLISAYGHYTE
ncbi:type II toxin-antitoxin system YoeB family toxin [Algoriphagus sp. NG3]|uniref:type II toxin-antitoxin system YoeB family toxin n=1 Tax=Algoriphagus sp. NG3 TaxID=3097546 RepID=UPI002A7FB5BA|nr:type II toxin-antitoxin system YoeB family toxin [Algoriphagus sp. NG3]WPR78022.1 type II toxin-antitoxin system YoeB family toxin [Algoriphagus sp. NG3]